MSTEIRKTVRVGTRESKLALLQTQVVLDRLRAVSPDLVLEVVKVKSTGDKVIDRPLAEIGSRGVFVKELEDALSSGEVDLVVHSLKDLPTDLPKGLTLAAVFHRADPRDVLVSRAGLKFTELPAGSRVATSSRRRAAQLRAVRTDVEFVDVRGNIPTRLKKLDDGLCDAMVLAAAGLLRLDEKDRITEYLAVETSTPAVGQGALAVECRDGDEKILELMRAIDSPTVRAEIEAERAFLHRLGGGCSVPIGAICSTSDSGSLTLLGCVAALDGSRVIRQSVSGFAGDAEPLGRRLAEIMLAEGAAEILDELKRSTPAAVSPP